MPTTRAMARQASTVTDDKENQDTLSLRKKPASRGAPKTSTTNDRTRRGHQATSDVTTVLPLSPKKVSQIAQTRSRTTRKQAANTKAAVCSNGEAVKSLIPADASLHAMKVGPVSEDAYYLATQGTTEETSRARARAAGKAQSQSAQPNVANDSNDHASQRPLPPTFSTTDRGDQEDRDTIKDRGESLPDQGSSWRSLHGTPMQDRKLQLPSPLPFRDSPIYQTTTSPSALGSDDELCGPKTPLSKRHQLDSADLADFECSQDIVDSIAETSNAKSSTKVATPTPSIKMLVVRSACDGPHTQKVPLKAADTLSPRRPMSVSRGNSVAYVFHPLPKASRVHSPIKGPYQWPVTPSDDGADDPLEVALDTMSQTSSRHSSGSASYNRPNTPGSRRTTLTDQSLQARFRLTQLFASDSDDEQDEDDEYEISFPPMQRSETPHDKQANAGYDPCEAPEQSEDEDLEFDTTLESNIMDDDSMCHNNSSIADEADESPLAPELHSEIFQSTPTQQAPSFSDSRIESSPLSEDELQSTPTITRLDNSSPTSNKRPSPRPRVSFALHEITADQPIHTPHHASRPSLSAFKTPHMRSALEEFDVDGSNASPSVAPVAATENRRRTICIDPSMLSQQASCAQMTSPRKDSVQATELASPAKPLPRLESRTVSSQMAPLVTTKADTRKGEQTARLSLLLNTDGLIESPEIEEQSWLDDADSTVVIHSQTPHKSDRRVSSGLGIDMSNEAEDDSLIHHPASTSIATPVSRARDLFNASYLEDEPTDDTPHYALPTISFDARRKSMPALSALTPKANTTISRGAETVIKPRATPSYSSLAVERQREPRAQEVLSRRQSFASLTPTVPKSQTRPTSLLRAPSSLSLRTQNSQPRLRHSFIAPDAISTPSATPRPRCYTPTIPFATIKASVSKPRSNPPTPPTMPSSPEETASFKSPPLPSTTTPARAIATPTAPTAFTPHPSAPLRGIVAYVEVFTRAGLSASTSFTTSLHRLGARTTRSFTAGVTHVVFKDGSPSLLQRIRIARKEGWDGAVVNSRWVTDCDALGLRCDEGREEYAVELEGSVGGGRRKKSMEPVVLSSGGSGPGTGVRARGFSRLSVASSVWAESPIKASVGGVEDHMAFSDEEEEESWFEGTTPGRAQCPGSVPVERSRKFGLEGLEVGGGGRRLTAWE